MSHGTLLLDTLLPLLSMALEPYTSEFVQPLELRESGSNGRDPATTPVTQKRQLEDSGDIKNPHDSSRPRLSTADEEVVVETPRYPTGEEHSGLPHNAQHDTDLGSTNIPSSILNQAKPQDQSTIKPPSNHHDLENKTCTPHSADNIITATVPHDIPHSWDAAHEADRSLFEMWNAGQDWLEIGKMWKQLTGEDATEVELANRYNRLTSETQNSLQDDDASLFAAVEEVMAKFKRDKWQLVSEAMCRRGTTIELSASQCRQRFKALARSSSKIPDMNQSPTIEQDQTEHTAPARPVSDTLIQDIREIDGSGIYPTANVSNGEPGILLNNATPLADSDVEPRTSISTSAQKTYLDTNVPLADPKFSAYGSARKENLSTDAVRASTVKTTASRVGSATNRGPARFTSFRRHKDEDALRRPKKSRDAPMNLNKVPRTDPIAMSSLQVNRVFSPYHPNEMTGILPGPSEQQISTAQPEEQTKEEISQQQPHLSQSPTAPECVGPQQEPCSLPPSSEARLRADSPPKSLPVDGINHSQPTQDHRSVHQRSLSQSFEKHVMNEASIPPSSIFDLVTDSRDPGKPKTFVTKQQLDCMIGNKRLDGPKGSKTWDMIARECGVNATVAEISSAFEEAGFPSIFRTPTVSPLPIHPVSPHESTEARSDGSPYTSAVTQPFSAAVNLQHSSRFLETPAPAHAAISESMETPKTETKRGPGRPRKESSDMSKSPSQVRKLGSRTPNPKISAAMTASWARRKENKRNEHGSMLPKLEGTAPTRPNPKDPGSAAQYAAQILAVADAQETGTPTPASAAKHKNALAIKSEAQDNESRDLLTGETMFAQHYDDAPLPQPIRGLAPPKSKKKIVRWCHNVFPQHTNADQH